MSNRTSRPAGWQLEQAAPEAYEQYLVPAIFTSWADRLVETADVREGDSVLDVACGTGVVARRAAQRVGETGTVVGIDVNEGMLAVAEAEAEKRSLSIDWRRGDATELPLSEERFDVVCCQQALQFLDPAAAMAGMKRVLAPDGRAALSVWRPLEYHPGYVVLAEALESHVGDEAGAMMRSPFPAWDGDDLEALARDAGFDDVSVTIEIGAVRYPSPEEFVRREAASSPLAEPLAAVERDVREALVQEVADGLEGYTDDDGVTSPMETFVLTANRGE